MGLNTEQLTAVNNTEGPMLVLAGAGSGKALSNSTKVLTSKGYFPIGKLRKTDKIYGSDGKLHKILGIYPQGKKKIFKIHFSDGTVIECCKDHLWSIKTAHGLKTFNTLELLKQKETDEKLKFEIPLSNLINFKEQNVILDPYILGVLIATIKKAEPVPQFFIKDTDLFKKVSEYFGTLHFELIQTNNLCSIKPTENSDEKIVSFLNSFRNKNFLNSYIFNSEKIRLSFLNGILDACGKNFYNYYELPLLDIFLDPVKSLAETLGFIILKTSSDFSIILNNQTQIKHVSRLQIFPSKFYVNKLHTLPSKNATGSYKNKRKFITDIEETKIYVPMTCIKVDAKDHLFVTEHCTLTHNTTVLVNRVAGLIEKGVDPKRILMLTFTNKAADEMMERINALLGTSETVSVQGGTYHSFCADLLRRHADEIGFESDFTVCDMSDASEMINLVKERLGYKKEDNLPTGKTINALFSYCVNQEKSIEYAVKNKFIDCAGKEEDLEKIRKEYIVYKYEKNILDYDDLLIQANSLFDTCPEICKKISNFYEYILVDEYQDSNRLQMELLIKMRQFENKNICVVGDPEQCLTEGTLIRTQNGVKKVEDINTSDTVLAAAGRGNLAYVNVLDINKKEINERIVNIKTVSGKTLSMTPEHIVFANTKTKDKYYTYLACFDGKYTVGVYNSMIKNYKSSYRTICERKNYEKIWVLDTFNTLKDAKLSLSNYHDNLFCKEIAIEILKRHEMYFNYPTYIKSNHDGSLFKINYTLFGDTWVGNKRKFYKSLIVSDTMNEEAAKFLASALKTNVCKKTQSGQSDRFVVKKVDISSVLESGFKNIDQLYGIEKFSPVFIENAFITENKTDFIPASHLKPGMYVNIFNNGNIVEEEISEVSLKNYNGFIYDINIDKVHNFFASDICVHNCIYGFRGSRYENILEFPDIFPGTEIVKLNTNYRSNQEILDLSNELLSGKGIFENKLKATYSCGYKPKIVDVPTQSDEADWIIRKINQYLAHGVELKDIAILSRGSNDSSMLEARLGDIEYNKFGGLKFWERESTKNVISYLKILNNCKDEISWFRILKLYPNIGSVNAKKLTDGIVENGIEELKDPKYEKKMYHEFLIELFDEYEAITDMDLSEKVEYLVNEYYQKVMKRSIQSRKIKEVDKRKELRSLDEDIERLQSLIELSKGYRSLNSYINDLLLDTSSSEINKDALTVSTIHSAKGLEWKVVFILDVIGSKFPTDRGVSSYTDDAIRDHEEELAEEKRIFYVACTRCKEDLYLMYPKYNIFSHTENDLSDYLVENRIYKTKCEIVKFL